MNQLMKNIEARMQGIRKIPDPSWDALVTVEEHQESALDMEYPDPVEFYKVKAEIGRKVVCRPDELPYMKRKVIEEINELVFGEFRLALHELTRAVYSRDYNEVRKATETL